MSLLLLNEDELRQTITVAEAINTVRDAFTASAEGRLNTPGHFAMNLAEVQGKVNVEGTYFNEQPYFVIKVDSHFLKNPDINLPAESGFLAIFDAASGFPAAIMVDTGYLTNLRIGAAGALTVDYLANEQIHKVAIIGANSQAYIQLKALTQVRDISSVWVWDHSPMKADNYVRHMVEDQNLDLQVASSLQQAVRQADVIIVTATHQPSLIQANWLADNVHITTVSTDYTTIDQRLHTEILQRAELIVVDDLEQCLHYGELHHALKTRDISLHDIAGELSSLISQKIKGRSRPDQITVADLTGLRAHDSALATLAMEKALFLGLGQRLEAGLGQKGMGVGVGQLL